MPGPGSVLAVGEGDAPLMDLRNTTSSLTVTFCFPCANVTDILEKIPSLLSNHPIAQDVVVHVGSCDIPKQ